MDVARPMAPQVTQVGPSGPAWGGGRGQLEANAGSWPVRDEPWMECRGEEKRHQERPPGNFLTGVVKVGEPNVSSSKTPRYRRWVWARFVHYSCSKAEHSTYG